MEPAAAAQTPGDRPDAVGLGGSPRFPLALPMAASPRSLPPATLKRLQWVRRLTRWLDRAVTVPGTRIRLGLDPILGLLPVGGDVVGVALSIYLMIEAARLGAPAPLLVQMTVNVLVDLGLGTVPVAGDVADVFWKANSRNLQLLEEFLALPPGEAAGVPWWVVAGLVAVLLGVAIAAIALTATVIGWVFGLLFGG
jgi:hypothetical protein